MQVIKILHTEVSDLSTRELCSLSTIRSVLNACLLRSETTLISKLLTFTRSFDGTYVELWRQEEQSSVCSVVMSIARNLSCAPACAKIVFGLWNADNHSRETQPNGDAADNVHCACYTTVSYSSSIGFTSTFLSVYVRRSVDS